MTSWEMVHRGDYDGISPHLDKLYLLQRLYDQDLALLEASPFLENRPVKFLVHGYLDSGEKRWIKVKHRPIF